MPRDYFEEGQDREAVKRFIDRLRDMSDRQAVKALTQLVHQAGHIGACHLAIWITGCATDQYNPLAEKEVRSFKLASVVIDARLDPVGDAETDAAIAEQRERESYRGPRQFAPDDIR